ncbi:YitT family protein [Caldisalinibacter kiritimatiensis]|uniref:DUF2179 domain-containing protein n=1 Tax=Caldisalinibacter kiritimatiensis TaxID=1304284 RepID=R1AVQ3_9FIRM|nr:YitT family protein [Caldisalinibacter kiritimatiensis]EOD00747.1 hypothetical protein L21TH_1199 [Caldisalinibacter kiritimatiensis]
MKKLIKDYIIITLGVVIVALGLSFFLVPADLAVGGVTGLAMVINNVFPQIPIGAFMFILNLILFIVGFILIGFQFGAKTIYASFALSGAIWSIEGIVHIQEPLVNDMFLNLTFGILIQGIGMAIVFYQNASTGGTDIVAKILNKFFAIDIGKALLLADFVVTFLAGITFGLELGLYALLGVIINAFVIDYVIEGLNMKINVSIITSYPQEIKEYINKDLNRGATIYKAEGSYTKEDRTVITTVLNKKEFIKLKKYIRNKDNSAFVTVSNVREVLGKGFSLT